jgi:shikimate dehydrogenase
MLTTDERRAAVLGSPVSHSLSPALHRAAYRALGLSTWRYEACEVDEPALKEFVAGLADDWAGLSLTMPLKEAALAVADEISDLAREVGAVNTLVRRQDGGWTGDNTDVHGVYQALSEAGCVRATSALVLGSGATARAVVAALAMLGARKVTFAVRSAARPETMEQARRAGIEVDVLHLPDLADLALVADRVAETPLVVSTLPRDSLPADTPTARLVPKGLRLEDHLVLDVVYAGWPTPLARAFEETGATVVSGLEMLVHQAAEQVRLMTGLLPPVEKMREAGRAAMGSP